jgi:hypothetical protein
MDGKILFYYIHFFNCCFIWICLTNNICFLQDTILGHEPRPIELFVETYVWNVNHRKGVQQLLDSRAQYFVVCWISTIAFLKLLFFWIWWICFFGKHITPSCRRDTRTIFRPIWNYDWRKDCQVDLIEIGFTISQTLQERTRWRPKVFQLLDARNCFREFKLKISMRF